jgi:hypothetical protein
MRVPVLLVLPLALAPAALAQGSRLPGAAMSDVVAAVEELDAMRSGLATAVGAAGGGPVDQQTFTQVCKPVAARAAALGEQHGWQVLQMAARNRNPKHALDTEGQLATRFFQRHPEALSLWLRSSIGGRTGVRYFRRITVEAACLACHGDQQTRPDFIRSGYPDDRAYGFHVGDLRGVYAVFVPEPITP